MNKIHLYLVTLVGAFFMTVGSVSALEVDTLVNLDQRKSLSGRFVYPILDEMDIVFSQKFYIPINVPGELNNEAEAEYGVDINTGVAVDVPIFGRFSFTMDITKDTAEDSSWEIGDIYVSKNFLYNLTDQVRVGFTLVYLQANFNASNRYVSIFPTVYPVIGASIEL